MLLKSTPALVGIATVNGRFVRVSQAWEHFLGKTVAELEGEEFIQFVHPDDQAATIAALSTLSDGEPVNGCENRYRSASGEYRHLIWRSDRGVDGLIYFTAEDISDARALKASLESSNERLSMVADIAGIGGWALDPASGNLFWDETTRRIHEVPDDFEPTVEKGVDFYDGEAAATIGAAVEDAIANQGSWDLVLPLITYTGKRIFVRAAGRPIIENGVLTQLTGTFQDVTEEREHAERLEMSRAAAESANEAKSRFLANMSHEIRTPLNGVLGMAQLLERTPLDERQSFYLRTLSESGGALVSLIDDVLDLSRIEAGQLALFNEPFSLEELTSNARSAVAAQAASKGLLVVSEAHGALPRFVDGDAARIKQVLINLLGNAVKFTDKGQVTLRTEVAEGDIIRFSVIDTGPGVPDDKKAAIFERFTQVDASNTRKQGGAGLGLAICRDLVRLAGGRIDVEDTPGGGATFWFEWPLPVASPRGAENAKVKKEESGATVLVAEDNTVNALLLEEALGASGYRVLHAKDGREAVVMALECPPDVMLLDIHMPELNGLEALKLIQAALKPSPPTFVLSADVTPQTRKDAEALNVAAFLAKPVNIDALLDALGAVTPPRAA
jgi:PAS domain S-box-containing protein